MKDRVFFILILVVLGVGQFLVVPIFSSQSLGGKVALFCFFVIALALCVVWQRRELILPWVLLPLGCLLLVFFVSLYRSVMPGVGIVELGTFASGLLFCILVANLSYENDDFPKWIFRWLQFVGFIVGILCLYQYFYWVSVGPSNKVLIPYLLPPCYQRVNGAFGQSNLTALLLVSAIIAFLYSYASRKDPGYSFRGFRRDVGFLFVSTAFFLTKSRAGLVAFFAVFAVLLLVVLRRKFAFSWPSSIKPILILGIGFIFSLLPLSPEIAPSFFARGGVSVEGRFIFWTASFLIFLDFPFLGVGLDHFKIFLPSYAPKAHDVLGFVKYDSMGYTNWSHNEYFQILAESGIVGIVFLTIFGVMLIRNMYKEVFPKNIDIERLDSERFFLFLVLLAFFIQGMFSWPFRHPSLLFLYFLILGTVLSKISSFRLRLRPVIVGVIVVFLIISSSGVAFFCFKEYRFNQLKREAKEKGCASDHIVNAMSDPYMNFNMLREVLPVCISDESAFDNRPLMEELKPYFIEISNLQGTNSQWYNLGLIYRGFNEYAQAEHAFKKAVERQPVFEKGWAVLHALHVEEAARQTGRPIQDFIPPDKNYSADYYDSFFKRQ